MPLRRAASIEEASTAMGIDWMVWDEITQAIPPVYSHFIGKQALEFLTLRDLDFALKRKRICSQETAKEPVK